MAMDAMKTKEFYTINEFARAIGVSESTLRNWDRSGKLKPHHRTKGNQRVYVKEQIDEFFGTDRIVKIQGRKGRDVYYFNYADNSVTDKIGNRMYLMEDIDDVQALTLVDELDNLFHQMYEISNEVNGMFRYDKKHKGEVKWVRMN